MPHLRATLYGGRPHQHELTLVELIYSRRVHRENGEREASLPGRFDKTVHRRVRIRKSMPSMGNAPYATLMYFRSRDDEWSSNGIDKLASTRPPLRANDPPARAQSESSIWGMSAGSRLRVRMGISRMRAFLGARSLFAECAARPRLSRSGARCDNYTD